MKLNLICKECGAKVQTITNTHLLNCSKITLQEYSIKHNIPLVDLLQYKATKTNKLKVTLNSVTPTEEEYSILVGTLLGDAWLALAKKHLNSTYLCVQHGIKQLDYLLWKGLKLKNLGTKFYQYYKYSAVANRYASCNEVRSKSSIYIADLARKFYQKDLEKKKLQDFKFIEKYLTPLALAVWYMDNGSYCQVSTTCEIYTTGFSGEEVDNLIKILNTKFDLNPKKHRITDNDFSIRFYVEERKKLFKIIESYIIPSMKYKLGKSINSPLMTICKRVNFDSAHYLEDHPAKCFNLHGGRYFLDVYIQNYVNPETGMVMDYTYLKKVVKQYIVDRFDHHFINGREKTLGWRSTTELISLFIWFTLIEFLPGLKKIVLWETPDSFCEFEGPSFKEIKQKEGIHEYLQFLRSFVDFNKEYKAERMIGDIENIFNEKLFDDSTVNGVSFDFIKTDPKPVNKNTFK